MKITKEEFDSLYTNTISHKDYNKIIEKIDGRVIEILRKISNRFDWWAYSNANFEAEGDGGEFDIESYKEDIEVGGEFSLPKPYSNTSSFPTRWLWEDFVSEFEEEVDNYKNKQTKKQLSEKEKREVRKQKLVRLQESIKQKLSPEELKAISFKK